MHGWAGFGLITLLSLLVLALLQGVTYGIGRRIGRFNVVDVSWGLGFVAVAAIGVAFGGGWRSWLLAVLVTVWGLRLSWHMYRKSLGKGEDPRYAELLERAGGGQGTVIRKVFLTQGLAQWFVSLPLQVSAVAGPTGGPGWFVLATGVLLWGIGLAFEAIGDQQLYAFKANPANRGRLMDRGLWAWTRHPNYFGDCCLWWGMWLIAASAWPGVVTVLSPIAMTYFLVKTTGAGLLERTMSQRPGYREYQQRTPMFFPRPPRTSQSSGCN